MWRRGRRCRAAVSACASRAWGRRCPAAAPQRHVTCRASASGLKKRRSVLKVGLFPLSSLLFFPSLLLISERAGSQEQRKTPNAQTLSPLFIIRSPQGKGQSLFPVYFPQSLLSVKTAYGFLRDLPHKSSPPRRPFPFKPDVYTRRSIWSRTGGLQCLACGGTGLAGWCLGSSGLGIENCPNVFQKLVFRGAPL